MSKKSWRCRFGLHKFVVLRNAGQPEVPPLSTARSWSPLVAKLKVPTLRG
jgi:hypothetical protein